MDPADLDRPDLPLYGLYRGVVLDNEDPLQLGRVNVRIPGLIDEGTGWALPMGGPGAGPNVGLFIVPPVGSDVVVFFHQGDPDQAHYMGGNWAKPAAGSDVPRPARDKGTSKTPNVAALAFGDFEFYFDDNATAKEFKVTHIPTGTAISIDGLTGSISLNAQANMSISAIGQIDITGLVVTINGIPAGSGRL